jgi:hypothetical protein
MWRSFALCALFSGVGLLWCFAATAIAEPPAPVVTLTDIDPFSREDIHRALERTISIAFKEMPLADVVVELTEKIGVPIVLDEHATALEGVGAQTPVTRKIDNVSGRGQLTLILNTLGLVYVVEEGFVLITTPEVAYGRLRTRVYPVGDLIQSTNMFNELIQDYGWLMELITDSVAPTTWDNMGAPGRIAFSGGNLIVSQTDETHNVIRALLAKIRMLRDSPHDKPLPTSIPVDNYLALSDAIFAQLKQHVTLQFVETPLFDVIEKLKALLKIEMQLDYRAMEDAGVGSDTPITFSCKSLYADVALRQLLEPHNLRFVVKEEILIITTPEVKEATTTLRLYPVRDLIDPNLLGTAAYDDLIEAMVSCIAPSTWDEAGGPGTIIPVENVGALLVGQTEENHLVLAKLLEDLRAANLAGQVQGGSNKPNFVTQVYHLPQIAIGVPPSTQAAADAPGVKTEDQLKESRLPAAAAAVDPPSDLIEVIKMIKKYAEPNSWEQSDETFIRIVRGNLLIRQRPIVHAKIEKLLITLNLIPGPYTCFGGMSTGPGTK